MAKKARLEAIINVNHQIEDNAVKAKADKLQELCEQLVLPKDDADTEGEDDNAMEMDAPTVQALLTQNAIERAQQHHGYEKNVREAIEKQKEEV